jgi:UDP-N-acetylmuramoyl-L-alanyl-D-glutamate--2,6-diaminopimelate ligase
MNSVLPIQVTGAESVNLTGIIPVRQLPALFAGLTEIALPDVEITDLTIDSKQARAGGAFIALQGLRAHGLSFAMSAVKSGATVVLWEPSDRAPALPELPPHAIAIAIPQLSSMLGSVADRFFGEPSRAVNVTGVTGTNGKTTTAFVLAAALSKLGKDAAYSGTLGHGRIAAVKPGTHTTPDVITVHRQIAELRDDGVTHLGMEVSSHALDQQRIAGVRVDTAVFTNLTHDHLDYHGTVEAYGAAKARLFNWPGLRHAVINIEDAFGRQLAASPMTASAVTLCGRSRRPEMASTRYVVAKRVVPGATGLRIDVESSWGNATLASRFIGDFNVDNALAVLAVLLGADVEMEDAIAALEQCVPPPGRMETFTSLGKPLVIVDYAHTPDALEKALAAARRHCMGKLICAFGCGGDRDGAKRPVMGAIAERLADVAIVTDDNPRTEDGAAIVEQICNGMIHPERALVERNRATAIEQAIGMARAGDAVLIAGKGHEDYQIVGLEKRYFSDRDVALAALRSTP